MDFSTKYWHLFKRSFPSLLRVHSFDFMPNKSLWHETVFRFPSFSFILQGSGEFRHRDGIWTVEAPYLLTEWPGNEPFNYGPRPPGQTWAEFYIKYEPESFQPLLDCGFIDREKPVRPIQQPFLVEGLLRKLEELSNTRNMFIDADWIDRLCEQLILAALTPKPSETMMKEDDVFKNMENFVKAGVAPDISLSDLARQFHMSPQTFRRRCHETHQISPVRYLTLLRIEEAGRLLIETKLSIAQIAKRTGFKDPQYFSRRFHQEMGNSPTAYRRGEPRD